MCDANVRLVVIRTKASKPYRYFFVLTTDMTLEVPQVIKYYRNRWQIETAFRDVKQHFGFDKYQVKSRKSINRFVQLSFVAASLTKLIFTTHPLRHLHRAPPAIFISTVKCVTIMGVLSVISIDK